MTGEAFPRAARLLRRGEFKNAYDKGQRIVSPFFVAFAVENRQGDLRVGVVASRRVGGAVARNRAKRMLREIIRRRRGEWGVAGVAADLVLVARERIVQASFAEVEAACARFVPRLLRRIGRGERPKE